MKENQRNQFECGLQEKNGALFLFCEKPKEVNLTG